MKRVFFIFSMFALMLIVCSCQAANGGVFTSAVLDASSTPLLPTRTNPLPTTTAKRVPYSHLIIDTFAAPYTTEELCVKADAVVRAKITDTSFYVVSSLPIKPIIYTTYTMEIQQTYMGSVSGTITINGIGGYPDCFLDEQLKLVEEYGLGGITVVDGMTYPEINKDYMFILSKNDDTWGFMTVDQYMFEIDEDEVVTDATVPSYKSILAHLENATDYETNG